MVDSTHTPVVGEGTMNNRIVMAMLLVLGLFASLPAWTGNARSVRKQAESSLRVTGTIVIGTDGAVQAHELDPEAPLTHKLAEFIGRSLDQWRFEPVKVNGEVVRARVPMSLRLVAKQSGEGNYTVRIASTHFGGGKHLPETDMPRRVQMQPPQFPRGALRVGGKGTVYLLVQIGSGGKVLNVGAEQVNLRVAGSEGQMKQLRKEFTDAATRAARNWTFIPPTTGEEVGRGSWLVRVPVDFRIAGDKTSKPGEWETYIPGPRNMDMPWAREQLKTAGSPDALPDDGIFPMREGAKLLTPPAA
jgi:TonB family protein